MIALSERGSCSLPGCENSRYQDPSNGRIHEFCSRSHASQSKQTGMGLRLCVTLIHHNVKGFPQGIGNFPQCVLCTFLYLELPQPSVKILKGNDPEAVQVTKAFTTMEKENVPLYRLHIFHLQ